MKAYSHIAAAILKDFFKFEPVISTVPVQGRFPVDVRSVPRADQARDLFSPKTSLSSKITFFLPDLQTYRPRRKTMTSRQALVIGDKTETRRRREDVVLEIIVTRPRRS